MKPYKSYRDEMEHVLLDYGNQNHKEGFIEGYGTALDDFYRALKHTHMTPEEIIKKLKLGD